MAETVKPAVAPRSQPAPVVAPKPSAIPEHSPIREIVDRFVNEIQVHPDANLLGLGFGGAIPNAALLPGLSPLDQQLVSLRFVMRK